MWAVFRALERGWTVDEIHELTHIDRWFLIQFSQIVELQRSAGLVGLRGLSRDLLRTLKRAGFADRELAAILGADEESIRAARARARARWRPTSGSTPAPPSSSRSRRTCTARFEQECEADPTPRQKVVILGSGPNRIGQGIEFDYCCCHAAFALRDEGFETVMVNCNPETVSTDYDTVDRLYFEPLTFEDVSSIIDARAGSAAATSRASSSTAARRR